MQGVVADPAVAPVTRQVSGRAAPAAVPSGPERGQPLAAAVAELPVLDASGRQVPFGALFRERRAVVVFVRVSAGSGAARGGTWPAGWGGGRPRTFGWGGHRVLGKVQRPGVRSRWAWPVPLPSTGGFRNANSSSLPLIGTENSPPSRVRFPRKRGGLRAWVRPRFTPPRAPVLPFSTRSERRSLASRVTKFLVLSEAGGNC